jgi:hypothetical protein
MPLTGTKWQCPSNFYDSAWESFSDTIRDADLLRKVHDRRIQILAFANNHYAGHGPAAVGLFSNLWETCGARNRRLALLCTKFSSAVGNFIVYR